MLLIEKLFSYVSLSLSTEATNGALMAQQARLSRMMAEAEADSAPEAAATALREAGITTSAGRSNPSMVAASETLSVFSGGESGGGVGASGADVATLVVSVFFLPNQKLMSDSSCVTQEIVEK